MNPPIPTRRTFLRTSAALAVTTPLLAGSFNAEAQETKRPLIAYVGTFSSPLRDMPPTQVDLPPGNGRGIHLFEVDRATGALTPIGNFRMGTSPNCLAINKAGNRLYCTNETDCVGKDNEGTLSAFAVDPADGKLTLLNTVRSGGKGPTHVSIHPSGRFILVANYFAGSVAVLPILADGRLGEPTDVKVDAGEIGPTKATNAPPGSFAISGHDRTHAHMIQPDASGRFALHVDLGLDKIFIWKFNATNGTLTPNDPPSDLTSLPATVPGISTSIQTAAGSTPSRKRAPPSASSITTLESGRLASRQTVSTLPPGYKGSNFCSAIRVSPDGHFVYAANRLHDSIAVFRVGQTGKLTYLGEEWTRGDYPRSFSFDPTGEFLYSLQSKGG